MDLLSKAVVAAVAIVVIIFAVYVALSHVSLGQQITEAQAASLVLHDLQNSNPGAAVNITNVTRSQYAGSWHILASVVTNATSPCPSYYIYSFDYPKYGFVYRVDNTYTSDCVVYGVVGNSYPIGSYPVAITASYSRNITAVSDFVRSHGFNNVAVHATYYNSTTVSGSTYLDVWAVNYSYPSSNSSVIVLLSQQNGTVMLAYSRA